MTQYGPNFFIVGAPKCGTTALYTYLSAHPDIFFPTAVKEPHYYNTDMPGFRWYTDKSKYLSLFDNVHAKNATIRGEASVQYLYSKVAAAEIAKDVPEARILICLRDPVSFIRSYHNQMLANLDEDLYDFASAWAASNQPRAIAREPSMLDYKSVGCFNEQVSRYRASFADDQIRILILEEFIQDPLIHYRALLKWLDVAYDGRKSFERVHQASRPRLKWLSGVVKSPPKIVKASSRKVKRCFGVKSLGIARTIAELNTAKGYACVDFDEDIISIVRNHYVADQTALSLQKDIRLIKDGDVH